MFAVGFAIKLDTTEDPASGDGGIVWAKQFDGYPRGTAVTGADADASGNMVVSVSECVVGTAPELYYGQPTGRMASACTYSLRKLRSADGEVLWNVGYSSAVSLGTVRASVDGSVYVIGTVTGSDVAIGDTNVSSETDSNDASVSSVLLFKVNGTDGATTWAKAFGAGSGGDMDLSKDGSKLVLTGSLDATTVDGVAIGGESSFVAEADPSTNQLQWAANMPWLRGIEVTDDSNYVAVYGQTTGDSSTYTFTDTGGRPITLRSRGSYDIFVAYLNAADGTGVWAIDGGGDNMEYFLGMGMSDDGGIYVSGCVAAPFSSRPHHASASAVRRSTSSHARV